MKRLSAQEVIQLVVKILILMSHCQIGIKNATTGWIKMVVLPTFGVVELEKAKCVITLL